MASLRRGEIVWVNLDPTVGGEIKKQRPGIIVSLTALNENRLTVVVVPLSSAGTPRPPLVVKVPSAGAHSNARVDQIRAVDKSRITGNLGHLSRPEMAEIELALRTILGI